MQRKQFKIGPLAISVGKAKDFIPPLSMFDVGSGSSAPLVTYSTKPQQLRRNIGWVFAANKANSEPAVSVPLKLRRIKKVTKDGKKVVEYEEITEHAILDLLERPHAAWDGSKLRRLNHTYLNLTGETYMLMRRNGEPYEMKDGGELPHALELLPSHMVQFKLGETRYSDSVVKHGRKEYKIGEVIRDFNPDPDSPLNGQSIVSAGAASIDSDNQMQSWNRRTFQNNARPGLVFNLTGDNIDDDVHERLKQQMQELYTGDGAFRSLVVENGEVKPYMLSPQDLDFLASRAFTREEIFAVWTTPPSVIGMTTDFNKANMEASMWLHLIQNIEPRLKSEVAMWNAQLVKKHDKTLELYFDSPIPEDVRAKLEAAKVGTNLWQTIDETREQYGLEPLPDGLGSQLIVPLNSTPISRVVAPSNAPDEADNDDDLDVELDDEIDDDTTTEGKKSFPKLAA